MSTLDRSQLPCSVRKGFALSALLTLCSLPNRFRRDFGSQRSQCSDSRSPRTKHHHCCRKGCLLNSKPYSRNGNGNFKIKIISTNIFTVTENKSGDFDLGNGNFQTNSENALSGKKSEKKKKLTCFHADFGKEFPSRTFWGGAS